MNNQSRTENVIKNVKYSVLSQLSTMVLQFILRTIFINTLGANYLGINGLFTNVLMILSFAELGIGNAIIFSLYQPLSINDISKVKALMRFYKLSYRFIAIVVGILGLLMVPFLGYLIGDTSNIPGNIKIYYLFFLGNTVASYLWIYKASIISADQKNYLVVVHQQFFYFVQVIIQSIFLLITKNYLVYLLIQFVMVIINNSFISRKADKIYPFLKDKEVVKLSTNDTKSIISNVKALVLYKLGSVVLNGTDNIIISILFGLTPVGIISNYTLILNAANSLLQKVSDSFAASVGNLNVKKDIKKQEKVFFQFLFINFWIYGIVSICLFLLLNPFISFWIGEKYTLDTVFLMVICINFYIEGIRTPSYVFRTTLGLFKEGRYSPVIAAITNIILSFLLGHFFGFSGVIMATIIVRFFIILLVDNYLINKHIKLSLIKYYCRFILYLFIIVMTTLICMPVTKLLSAHTFLSILIRGCLIFIISNTCFIFMTFFLGEFKSLKSKFFFKLRRNLNG